MPAGGRAPQDRQRHKARGVARMLAASAAGGQAKARMTGRLADFSQIILVFSLPLKLAQVLQAIVAGGTGNQRTAGPVMEQPVYIFTRNTCHRSKVGLRDLLSNHNASLADLSPERISKTQ